MGVIIISIQLVSGDRPGHTSGSLLEKRPGFFPERRKTGGGRGGCSWTSRSAGDQFCLFSRFKGAGSWLCDWFITFKVYAWAKKWSSKAAEKKGDFWLFPKESIFARLEPRFLSCGSSPLTKLRHLIWRYTHGINCQPFLWCVLSFREFVYENFVFWFTYLSQMVQKIFKFYHFEVRSACRLKYGT